MLGEMKTFTVEGKLYHYLPLNPLEAITFCAEVAKICTPLLGCMSEFDGQSIGSILKNTSVLSSLDAGAFGKLIKEALSHCVSPENQDFSNEALFNKYFSENPQELLQAGVLAVFHLAKDFFPKGLLTPTTENN